MRNDERICDLYKLFQINSLKFTATYTIWRLFSFFIQYFFDVVREYCPSYTRTLVSELLDELCHRHQPVFCWCRNESQEVHLQEDLVLKRSMRWKTLWITVTFPLKLIRGYVKDNSSNVARFILLIEKNSYSLIRTNIWKCSVKCLFKRIFFSATEFSKTFQTG